MSPPKKGKTRDAAVNRAPKRLMSAQLQNALRVALRMLTEAEAARIIGGEWATPARLTLVHEAHVRAALARAGLIVK